MTVLFLDPVGTLGGAERCLLDLAASMRASQRALRMGLIVGGDGPLVAEAERIGMEVTVLPLPRSVSRAGDSAIDGLAGVVRSFPSLLVAGAALGSYGIELERIIRRFRPTVIHSNGMKMHLLSALLPRYGVPVIWHLRDFLGQRAIMAHVLGALSRRADGVLAISRAVAEDAARTLGRDDVRLIYDAIDTDCFVAAGERLDLDGLAGLPPPAAGTLRIGLVATYARWKGQEVFIDSAAAYRARGGPPARFYIIGGPAYDTEDSQFSMLELRQRIAARGLADGFGLVPFQPEPQAAYRSLDVAVHASTRPEPFGRTIAEAMSCGRALVIANEGGAAELVSHDHDAIAVAPRDPETLAGALVALAADPAKRARLGAAARITAETRYARARIGPETLAAYAAIRGAAGSGGPPRSSQPSEGVSVR
ncbi:MAG TPA: glycosyltransferase [Polyangiaceae bacterium]|jgi:glycosyltransferase involved in cell wall biosynthesis